MRRPPTRPPRPRPRRGRSRSPTASGAAGSTANAVVIGAIVTPEMRAERPDETFATFTPAGDIAEAIAYLFSDAASTMNGQRLVLRGAA